MLRFELSESKKINCEYELRGQFKKFLSRCFVLHEKVFTNKKNVLIVAKPTGKHSLLRWRSEVRLPKRVSID